MPLIPSTVINSTNAGASPELLKAIQAGAAAFTSSGINTSIVDASSKVTAVGASATSGLSTISGVVGSANASLSTVKTAAQQFESSVLSKSTSYLSSALASVSSTFDKSVTGLASGLTTTLSGVFKDSTIKSAAASVTDTSDAVKTNFTAASKPNSGPFKIGPNSATSEVLKLTNTITTLGTKANLMVGTKVSTVLNRFNLDKPDNLISKIAGNSVSKDLAGLFSTAGAVSGLARSVTSVVSPVLSKSTQNDIEGFLGRTRALTNLTGTNASQYYLQNSNYSLVTNTGVNVDTNQSGVDADTANGILALAKVVGCDVSGFDYFNSLNQMGSIFNLILSLASQLGMKDIVDALMGCTHGASSMGKLAAINAFNATAATNPAMGSTLINYVDNKTALKSDYLVEAMVTNQNLSVSQKGDVDFIMQSMGTTTVDAYKVKSDASGYANVFDAKVLSASNPDFTNAVLNDKTLTTFMTGVPVTLKADGSFTV